MMTTVLLLASLAPYLLVSSFSDQYLFGKTKIVRSRSALVALVSDGTDGNDNSWLSHGLLLSSFSDGLRPNPKAQDFLMRGLVTSLWKEQQAIAEAGVAESALQSPCCGPDLNALSDMETADAAIAGLEQQQQEGEPQRWQNVLHSLTEADTNKDAPLELRFLYIPTAMYALRSNSENSPGKQRQRNRADGKKRRTEIAKLLSEQLGDHIDVLTVSLDLDDASVKQPEGSDDPSRFPTNGKDAISQWKPHFIYVQGGNTFWLYHCIEKGDWANDLVNACTGDHAAVYCGTSAGAIIMGESMETACWKGWDDPSVVPGKETYADWKGVKGFGLAGKNVSFFPHMGEQWQPLVDEKQTELPVGSTVYCLRDEELCCVEGKRQSISELSVCQEPVA